MTKFKDWFTSQRRQAIQLFFGSLAPFFILFGFGTDGFWEQALIITGAGLQFISSGLSMLNLKGAVEIWTILRGAIYTLATTVSPALVLLGFYDEDTNATILTATSLALGALSNLLAIFTAGHQEKRELEQTNTIKVIEAYGAGLKAGKAE
jgi:hypothetical protein